MTDASTEGQPFRRAIFFIHGYHAHGFRFFWPLLSRGVRQHEQLYGRKIKVARAGDDAGSLKARLTATDDGRPVEADYHFLGWEDAVAWQQAEPLWRIWPLILVTLAKVLLTGAMARCYRAYWGYANTFIFLYFGTLLFSAIGAALLAVPLHLLGAPAWATLFAGYLGATGAMYLADRNDDRLRFRLMYGIHGCTTLWRDGRHPGLDARLDDFAADVAKALTDERYDEVLVIGHSYGTLLSPIALKEALDKVGPDGVKAGHVGLLGLGDASPIALASLGSTARLRTAMRALATDRRVSWLNVFCKQDRLNFQRVNPATRYLGAPEGSGPTFRSMKLRELLTEEHYRPLVRSFWQLHFIYLYENDFAGDYSIFRFFCGARPMMRNFGHRERREQGA